MTLSTKNIFGGVLIISILAIFFVLLVMTPIYGADFYYVFFPIAEDLWAGDAILYVTTDGYFNPAHAMFYWMALTLTPVAVANAIHFLGTFILLFALMHLWQQYSGRSVFRVLFAMLGLYTIDHLIRGQMDVIAVFGVVLAFWATKEKRPYLLGLGATIAVIKPTSLVLPLLMIAWHLRTWSLRQVARATLIPIATIIATILAFGVEWIPNLIGFVANGSPVDGLSALSLYDMATVINLPIIIPVLISLILAISVFHYRELTATHFAFALGANLLASTYIAGYHFVVLIPAILCMRHRWQVVIAFILSLLPILRNVTISDSITLDYLMLLLPVYVVSVLFWQMMHDDPA